jgi:integrase
MASKGEKTRASRSPIGTIEKRENGRYRVRYTDPGGRRVTAGTYASKQLAQAQLNRIQFAIESGEYSKRTASKIGDLDSKTATLRELAEHWRSTQLKGGRPLAISTLKEYERLIVNVLSSMADSPVRSITPGQIEKWWRPEHLRAPNQASKAYKHLKTLMSFAVERRWIMESPCVIKGATSYRPASRPEAPTREQVNIMIESAAEPFKVVMALAAWGGFRKGELFELRRKDLEFLEDQGETWTRVRIERAVTWDKTVAIVKVPKTEGSIRTITLPLFMTDLLKRHLATVAAFPEALLFEKRPGTNEHWSEFQLRQYWEPARAVAGFNGRFHSLRTFALTEFGQLGPSMVELLNRGGHRNVDVAMRYQRDTGREIELLRRLPNG